jgi:hypothetical protein
MHTRETYSGLPDREVGREYRPGKEAALLVRKNSLSRCNILQHSADRRAMVPSFAAASSSANVSTDPASSA